MASTTVRRPLPALISLLALLLLTGIVWWRVISRDDSDNSDAADCPSPSPTTSSQAALPAPASIAVQVLNSTQKAGLAGRVRRSLAERGFQTPDPAGNSKPLVRASAQLRYGPTGKQAAQLLQYYLPGSVLVPTQAKNATVVVAVGAGYRRLATEQELARALAADKVSVATSSPSAAPSSDANC